MSDKTDTLQNETALSIPEDLRIGIRRALTQRYLQGLTIEEAFNLSRDFPSRDTYYKYLRISPGEMEELDAEAARIAAQRMRELLDVRQLRLTVHIQEQAALALDGAIINLKRIVDNEPWMFPDKYIVNSDGVGEWVPSNEYVRIYPRDVSEASRIIQSIGERGVVPALTQQIRAIIAAESSEKEEQPPPRPARVLGISPDFTRIEAIQADGTRYVAEVKRDNDVVDAEVSEPTP